MSDTCTELSLLVILIVTFLCCLVRLLILNFKLDERISVVEAQLIWFLIILLKLIKRTTKEALFQEAREQKKKKKENVKVAADDNQQSNRA